MRILIAGLGSIGRRHLKNLVALGERDFVLYRTGKSTLPEAELEGYETLTDLQAALDRRPQAVIVSNPTALHLDVAIPAAERGCHLLLEKPVSHSMERIDALRHAVAKSGSRVLMGFQFRHHPTLQKARAFVEAGSLGSVIAVRAAWGEYLPGWHPWEDHALGYAARPELGGGALLTLCHPFDYLRWIFGELEEARGLIGEGLGLTVEAVVEAGLRFRSGVLASVHLDYLQRLATHELDIVGERGRLHWDGLTGDLDVTSPTEGGSQRIQLPAGYDRNDLFLAEMEHFLAVAEGAASPVCTLEDGIRVQEVLERIRSSALDRAWARSRR